MLLIFTGFFLVLCPKGVHPTVVQEYIRQQASLSTSPEEQEQHQQNFNAFFKKKKQKKTAKYSQLWPLANRKQNITKMHNMEICYIFPHVFVMQISKCSEKSSGQHRCWHQETSCCCCHQVTIPSLSACSSSCSQPFLPFYKPLFKILQCSHRKQEHIQFSLLLSL